MNQIWLERQENSDIGLKFWNSTRENATNFRKQWRKTRNFVYQLDFLISILKTMETHCLILGSWGDFEKKKMEKKCMVEVV